MTLDESKKLLADMYDALNAQDLEAQHKYWHDAVSYTHLTLPTKRIV